MRARLLLVLTMVAAPLLVPGTASAGCGADVGFADRDVYHLGGTIERLTGTVHRCATGWEEDGPFSAYLVAGWAAHETNSIPEGAIHLAPVRIVARPSPSNAEIEIEYRSPHVAPGRYTVLVCNAACSPQFGDMYGMQVTFVESAQELRTLTALNRMQRETWRQLDSNFRHFDQQINRLDRDLATRDSLYSVDHAVTRLERRIVALEAQAASAGASSGSWWFGIGAGSTLLALGAWRLLVGLRRRRELRELLAETEAPAAVVPFELEPVD